MILGAGRNTVADTVDPAVGIELGRKVGDAVQKGDLLATLHYNDRVRLDGALVRLSGAFEIAETPIYRQSLVRRVVD